MFGQRRIVRIHSGASRVSKRLREENKEFPPGKTYFVSYEPRKPKKGPVKGVLEKTRFLLRGNFCAQSLTDLACSSRFPSGVHAGGTLIFYSAIFPQAYSRPEM